MKQVYVFLLLIVTTLSGCSSIPNEHHFQMDYPLQAARLSIGGEVSAIIKCDTHEINIISDTSGGLFSNHIKRRINNICYNNNESFHVIYKFDPVRGARQNLLATQPNRNLPVLNTYELG